MYDFTIIHPVLARAITKVRCSDLLEEAEFRRLVKRVTFGQPQLSDRLFLSTGDALIACGLWLKARCQPRSSVPFLRADQWT